MKAYINANGVLTIRAENTTEGYALGKWLDDNAVSGAPELPGAPAPQFIPPAAIRIDRNVPHSVHSETPYIGVLA